MTNTEKAISDFKGYIRELRSCSPARRREIRREGVTCGDLMNASPLHCWQRPDFLELDSLVGKVMNATSGE